MRSRHDAAPARSLGSCEPVRRIFGQDRAPKGRNDSRCLIRRLSYVAHLRAAGVCKQRAAAEGPGPELHAPLKPAHDLPVREQRCRQTGRIVRSCSAGKPDRAIAASIAAVVIRRAQERSEPIGVTVRGFLKSRILLLRDVESSTDRRAGIMGRAEHEERSKRALRVRAGRSRTVQRNPAGVHEVALSRRAAPVAAQEPGRPPRCAFADRRRHRQTAASSAARPAVRLGPKSDSRPRTSLARSRARTGSIKNGGPSGRLDPPSRSTIRKEPIVLGGESAHGSP